MAFPGETATSLQLETVGEADDALDTGRSGGDRAFITAVTVVCTVSSTDLLDALFGYHWDIWRLY